MGFENNENKKISNDVELLKQKARESGLSYNEAIEYIAKTTGGRNTSIYSDTDAEEIKRKNEQ